MDKYAHMLTFKEADPLFTFTVNRVVFTKKKTRNDGYMLEILIKFFPDPEVGEQFHNPLEAISSDPRWKNETDGDQKTTTTTTTGADTLPHRSEL